MRDIHSNLAVSQLLDPAVVSADATSGPLDLQGFASALLIASVGQSGDALSASLLIECEVEESDDGVSFADVADGDLTSAVAASNPGTFARIDDPAEDQRSYVTGYRGTKRYLRVVVNLSGIHSAGTPIAVTAVRGHASLAPVNP